MTDADMRRIGDLTAAYFKSKIVRVIDFHSSLSSALHVLPD